MEIIGGFHSEGSVRSVVKAMLLGCKSYARTLFMEIMKNNIDNMDKPNRMKLQSTDGA